MSTPHPVYVQVAIDWTQTRIALYGLLNYGRALPPGITDQQLANVISYCENARERLKEERRG